MESEDIFSNFSEEIVTENVDNIEEEQEICEETEDMIEGTNFDEEIREIPDADKGDKPSKPVQPIERELKLIQLPISRIKNLMGLDPDFNRAYPEAFFLVTRATELFIDSLAKESYRHTAQAKKKTVQKRDVDMAISAVDSLMFLQGAMN